MFRDASRIIYGTKSEKMGRNTIRFILGGNLGAAEMPIFFEEGNIRILMVRVTLDLFQVEVSY